MIRNLKQKKRNQIQKVKLWTNGFVPLKAQKIINYALDWLGPSYLGLGSRFYIEESDFGKFFNIEIPKHFENLDQQGQILSGLLLQNAEEIVSQIVLLYGRQEIYSVILKQASVNLKKQLRESVVLSYQVDEILLEQEEIQKNQVDQYESHFSIQIYEQSSKKNLGQIDLTYYFNKRKLLS